MNKTIEHKCTKEFCLEERNIDMSYCRDKFLKYLKGGARILDAECGSGRDSKVFILKEYDVVAMAASKDICEEAEKFIGQSVINLSFKEIDFNNEFDGIWAYESLMRISNDEIDGVLMRIRRALKESGVLYASFKNGDGEKNGEGFLFNYYNKDVISKKLEENGFKILEIFEINNHRDDNSDEEWLNVIAKVEKGNYRVLNENITLQNIWKLVKENIATVIAVATAIISIAYTGIELFIYILEWIFC